MSLLYCALFLFVMLCLNGMDWNVVWSASLCRSVFDSKSMLMLLVLSEEPMILLGMIRCLGYVALLFALHVSSLCVGALNAVRIVFMSCLSRMSMKSSIILRMLINSMIDNPILLMNQFPRTSISWSIILHSIRLMSPPM